LPFQSAADSIISYSPPYYNEAPGPGPGAFVCPESRPDPKAARLEAAALVLPETRPNIIVCILFVLWL